MLQSYLLILMTKLNCVAFNEEKQIRPFRGRDSISKPFSEYPVYIQKQKVVIIIWWVFFKFAIYCCAFWSGIFVLHRAHI